jgi:hypothetical protein
MFLSLQFAFQRARFVIDDVYVAASQMIIGQLHDVIKVFARPTYMQNVDETGVRTRDRLKAGHAFEFTSKRALIFKRAAINNFDRPQRTGESARQPNFSVSAATDHAQHFMVGNNWNFGRNFLGNERDFTQAPCANQFQAAPLCRSVSFKIFYFLFDQRRDAVSREINLANAHTQLFGHFLR